MIRRHLEQKLRRAAREFPVVTVTGPRQSGKTTLVRAAFPDSAYVSLELPDQRAFALEDPRGFLAQFDRPVVLDEAQRAPELFSYIQVRVDERDRAGQFILTGSHNFLLMQSISQSLAGRAAVLHLLPFSLAELGGRRDISLATFSQALPRKVKSPSRRLMEVLFTGFYPRIHDKKLSPPDWLASYYQTYLERDVRSVLNVGDLESFGRFVRLCAGRNGQLLNLSGLAADGGIAHTTAKRWISLLEASFILVLLRPYYKNFGKRLTKSPKLYFLDTGLLCSLLRIQSPEDLYLHAARGSIFESFVLSEFYKNFLHRGEQPGLYFWRDSAGHEVDVLLELGSHLIPVEIKSGETIAADSLKGLNFWRELSGNRRGPAVLVYGGDRLFKREGVSIYPWFAV
jgi:predicted AAA+ superfamily ATPase